MLKATQACLTKYAKEMDGPTGSSCVLKIGDDKKAEVRDLYL
jgi:hypothetical protein